MAGTESQFGLAEEVVASVPAPTAGVGVAGVPNRATLTFGSAHGISVGAEIDLAGFTPSPWNGTWTVVAVADSTHLTIGTGSTLLATVTGEGTVTRATNWGVSKTPNRFFEIVSETLSVNPGRIEGKGIRAGNQFLRKNRMVTYPIDATGDTVLEAWTTGQESIFDLMLGKHTVTGPNADGAYTHVFTCGTLRGKSATLQFVRPTELGELDVFTYVGCKVAQAKIEAAVDALLMITPTWDARLEARNVAAATPSYPDDVDLLSYVGGSVTFDSDPFPGVLTKCTFGLDNKLKADRRGLGSASKNEQIAVGNGEFRAVTVDIEAEFQDETLLDKFMSTVPELTTAAITQSFVGPTLIGDPGTSVTFPSLTIDTPNVRIDGQTPNIAGPGILGFKTSGPAMNTGDGANDAITITVVSSSATL